MPKNLQRIPGLLSTLAYRSIPAVGAYPGSCSYFINLKYAVEELRQYLKVKLEKITSPIVASITGKHQDMVQTSL
jgi:hypothetical protein